MGTGTDATSFEASIRDASTRWMYPESETSWRRSRGKSPPISPSAPGRSKDFCSRSTEAFFPRQRTLEMASVLHGMYFWCCTIHILSLEGYDVPAVILLLITLAGDVESNPGPPKIFTCPICSQRITNNKKYKEGLSYASLAKTGSTLPAQHLLTQIIHRHLDLCQM